jgi:hypothetical protein
MLFEVIILFVLVLMISFILNSYLFLRTAASLFLAILISAVICYAFFQSTISEIAITVALIVGLVYAIFRAIRDKRDM